MAWLSGLGHYAKRYSNTHPNLCVFVFAINMCSKIYQMIYLTIDWMCMDAYNYVLN